MATDILLNISAAPIPAGPKAHSVPLTIILPEETGALQYGAQLLEQRLGAAHGA